MLNTKPHFQIEVFVWCFFPEDFVSEHRFLEHNIKEKYNPIRHPDLFLIPSLTRPYVRYESVYYFSEVMVFAGTSAFILNHVRFSEVKAQYWHRQKSVDKFSRLSIGLGRVIKKLTSMYTSISLPMGNYSKADHSCLSKLFFFFF